MALNGYQAMRIREFGGLNTLTDATNLPIWSSPDCQDVEFLPGLVRTRPGLTSQFAALGGGTVTVNYLKTYINSLLQHRLLSLTPGIASLSSAGAVLYKESPQETLNIVSQAISSNYCSSCSAFTREYLAFGDGMFGIDIPRQFDDTNLDRVSQEGPGTAPSVGNEVGPLTIVASPAGISRISGVAVIAAPNGATESGNIVTLTSLAGNFIFSQPGDSILVAGVAVGGYNGTYTILSISPDFASCTVLNPASGLAASGGGTITFSTYQVFTTTPNNFGVGNGPSGTITDNPGPTITIAGAGVGAYNGTWPVRSSVGGSSIFINIAGQFALASSGNGTMQINGNIQAGSHQISVMFVTRNGYITRPAPPGSWIANGGHRALVSNIPIGPPNVVARILIFTAFQGNNFFYIPDGGAIFSGNMVIADNTSTTAIIDFTDELLLSGVVADDFFDLVVLGECLGNISYSSRLFWWGERNQLQNLLNVGFDGGFTNPGSSPNSPLGWIQDQFLSAGGASALAQGFPAYSGDAYAITGNGVIATRGKITQTLFQDYLGNPVVSPSTSYSIRARIAKTSGLAAGTLHINAFSANGGFTTTGISLIPSQLATWYQEFTATLLPSQTSIPSDLVLQIYADGTPTNNQAFLVDCIGIYPTNQPFIDASTIRASKVEDPESYNGVTGFLQVAEGDGTRVTSSFVLRKNLYFSKERSLYVTQDDGANEPSNWSVQQLSEKVGTPSVKGIGIGDEWVIIAAQDGVYYFDGGLPQKISQEIQPTWDAMNLTVDFLIEVVVDVKRKRVYISIPLGSATSCNKILTLDYTQGFTEPQEGVGRKWSPWAIRANSMNLVLRDDGTLPLFIGNGAGNGAIYKLDPSSLSDDGAAIDSYWQTGFFQDDIRLNFGYIVANIVGNGSMSLTLRKGDQSWATQIRGWFLNSLGYTNVERQIQKQGYRMAVRFETNLAGSNFSMQGVSMYVTEAIWAPARGINA